ncbi:MAG: rod shape-determining protein MreC [Ardenticatenaceae bacterium]|nr:rod shape-determining protein MreC [Ardenticatenaceae bacterium]HBY98995.1 rod shape-determining protein MreC [Chloroflexota bacterium]
MIRLRNNSQTLFLLLALALILLILDRAGNLDTPQDIVQQSLGPVERLLTRVGGDVDEIFKTLRDLRTLRAENERLKAQVEQLTLVNVQRIESEKENERLRDLLNFKRTNPNYTLLAAQVVAREEPAHITGHDPSNLIEAIRLDQGRRDGVVLGMPVVTARGLVGRVIEVGENWSKVLLVLDESSAVAALVQQSRATGVVEGVGNDLVIRYIPHDQSIEPGDIILTSGLGGEFPKGLVVGTVEEVRKHDVDPYQEATVRSPIDFTQLEYVFIIKAFRPGSSREPR